ncbi:helix-turn-helix domain-containing protein [Allosalinactinospora lopnorensis]|uniref:helix-turn-helix domain-containing protein n=1 Tax=Allosalinactinospora lopnorensis TaxID=1352348 RepID=UPI001F27E306|nr:helix-turn-helix transcriptional regulator [Allosalinactinospora lopnorensis]
MSGNGLQRSSLTFGQRVRRLRERNGQTRATVGNLVGRSAEWVKAIEAGRLKMPRLPLLLQLASVLGVNDLGELTGESGLSVPTRISPPHAAVFTVAESLTAYPLDQASTSEGGTDDLCERVRQAWRLWHHSPNQRTRIATVLPALLSDLRRASRVRDHADQRHVLSALAQTYHLTQLYLSFQPVPGLVMLAGDRAMQAAQDADDPHAIAVAAWYMSHVLRDSGQRHEARLDLTTRAAALLRPESGAEDLARWGLLQLAAALSFAREGLSEPAWRYWERANRAARALGASYVHPFLIFGQAWWTPTR